MLKSKMLSAFTEHIDGAHQVGHDFAGSNTVAVQEDSGHLKIVDATFGLKSG